MVITPNGFSKRHLYEKIKLMFGELPEFEEIYFVDVLEFCKIIYDKYYEYKNWGMPRSLATKNESLNALELVCKEKKINVSEYSYEYLGELKEKSGDKVSKKDKEILECFDAELKKRKIIDEYFLYDSAYNTIRKSVNFCKFISEKFDYYLVDDVEDLTNKQQEIICYLANGKSVLFAGHRLSALNKYGNCNIIGDFRRIYDNTYKCELNYTYNNESIAKLSKVLSSVVVSKIKQGERFGRARNLCSEHIKLTEELFKYDWALDLLNKYSNVVFLYDDINRVIDVIFALWYTGKRFIFYGNIEDVLYSKCFLDVANFIEMNGDYQKGKNLNCNNEYSVLYFYLQNMWEKCITKENFFEFVDFLKKEGWKEYEEFDVIVSTVKEIKGSCIQAVAFCDTEAYFKDFEKINSLYVGISTAKKYLQMNCNDASLYYGLGKYFRDMISN